MLGWLKKTTTEGTYAKPHYRKLTTQDKKDIEVALRTKVQWSRGYSKRSYFIAPLHTVERIAEATGKNINFINGDWYEVTWICK